MKLYQFSFNNRIYRQGTFCAAFLAVALIVGCVSGRQETSNGESFIVSNVQNTLNYIPRDIDAKTSSVRQWRGGDIIYVANGHIDHMAMIDDSAFVADNGPDIIDSNRNGVIRRYNNFDKWADHGGWSIVEGYYVPREEKTDSVAQSTINTFNIGDVYNAQAEMNAVLNRYKRNSPPNTHSSQLVRQAYKHLYNIDLDVDGGWWSWPKDIRQNPNVKAIPGASFVRS